MRSYGVCVCVCVCLTALLHGLVGPVFAVLHVVTHLAAVDALAVLAAELSGAVALCDCWRQTIKETEKLRKHVAVAVESNPEQS